MNLSDLRAPHGAVKKTKRRGRGQRSGHGKTSCKGNKGANARAGATTHLGFEGGQMALIRRIPKRGFNHPKNEYIQIVNIQELSGFQAGQTVEAQMLKKKGLIKNDAAPVKILGTGSIEKALTVKASAFSASAKEKIEKAGGKTEIV
jgi:large subunit ribosomal protein L15